MSGPNLPTNVDATYPGSAADPTWDIHQQHHDLLHRFANRYDIDAIPGDGQVITFDGATNLYKPKTPSTGGGTPTDLTGTPLVVSAASGGTGAYPTRPATTRPVLFRGVTLPSQDGSTAGGGGMVPGLDQFLYWSSADNTGVANGSVTAAKLDSHALDTVLPKTKAGKPIYGTIIGNLVVGTGTTLLPITEACTLTSISIRFPTAPTGSAVIFDVNLNGSATGNTIFTDQTKRPTVAAGAVYDLTPGTDASSSTFAAGDYLIFDVDQVGSTIPGANASIVVVLTPV